MKVSRLISFVVGLSALLFASCNPEGEFTPSISIQSTDGQTITSLTLTGEAQNAKFNILSNISWTINNDAEWLSIDRTSSANDTETIMANTVTVSVDANTTGQERTASLTVIIQGTSLPLLVTQQVGSSSGSLDSDVALSNIDEIDIYYCGLWDGVPYWDVYIWDSTYVINTILNTSDANFSAGIPSATYTISAEGVAGTADIGEQDEEGTYGTWLYLLSDDSIGNSVAAMESGSIKVENKGATYTFTLNLADVNNHAVTGTYTGEVYATDDTATEANYPSKFRSSYRSVHRIGVAKIAAPAPHRSIKAMK
ncbi:MAG: BACON domain-containing protein [Tidjanibacter sp.]|nr:BACON domain-containing protein [Tidjanibacter sp.]